VSGRKRAKQVTVARRRSSEVRVIVTDEEAMIARHPQSTIRRTAG
jgi:acetate kinase